MFSVLSSFPIATHDLSALEQRHTSRTVYYDCQRSGACETGRPTAAWKMLDTAETFQGVVSVSGPPALWVS